MPTPAIVDIFQLVMGTLLKCFINTMSLPSAMLYPVAFLTWQGKAKELQELELCLWYSSSCHGFQYSPWHISVKRLNRSVNPPPHPPKQNKQKTKQKNHNLLLKGGTWQHISELEQKFAEKSFLLSKSLWTNGNHSIPEAFSSYVRHMIPGILTSGLINKELLSSIVSCNSHFTHCLFQLLHFKVKDTETQRLKPSASGLSQVHRRAWTRPQANQLLVQSSILFTAAW